MIPSPINRSARLIGTLFAAILLMAQAAPSGQPLSILPTPPPNPDAPAQILDSDAPLPQLIAPAPGGAGGVEVDTLGQDSVAARPPDRLLEPENGGLGYKLWDGSDPATILRLLQQTPAASFSPAMNRTLRRLILSRTLPAPDTQIILEMLRLLYDSGQVDAIPALAHASQAASPDITLWTARAYLARGNIPDACALLPRLSSNPSNALFPLKLAALCDAVAGNADDALLALDLARENGFDDPLFTTLLIAANDELDPDLPTDAIPDPFHAALLRAAGKTFPPQHVLAAPPSMLLSLALDTGLPDAARLRAAERATTLQILSGDTLAALYAAIPFDGIQIADPQITADSLPDPLANALYYQATLSAPDPAIRARLLAAAFQAAPVNAAFAVAQANAPALRTISPTIALAWFAPQAISQLSRIGEFRRVSAWAAVLPNPPPPASLLARIADADIIPPDPDDADSSLPEELNILGDTFAARPPNDFGADNDSGADDADDAAVRDADPAPRTPRQAAILNAIGLPPVDQFWQDIALTPSDALPAAPGQLSTLQAFARHHHVGLTVLLSMIALRHDGPENAAPETLEATISALRQVGLHQEARAIAVEALLRVAPNRQPLQ